MKKVTLVLTTADYVSVKYALMEYVDKKHDAARDALSRGSESTFEAYKKQHDELLDLERKLTDAWLNA